MSYSLSVLKEAINIPTIPGDLFEDAANTSPNLLFSSQQSFPYIVDLTFSLFQVIPGGEGGDTLIPEPITSLQITTPGLTGVTFTVVNSNPLAYKVRVDGVLNSDFVTPPTYSFVLDQENYSNPFPTLDNVNTANDPPENFLAVYRFEPTTVFFKFEDPGYVINTTPTASLSLSQYVYWGWPPAIQNFKDLVLAGSI